MHPAKSLNVLLITASKLGLPLFRFSNRDTYVARWAFEACWHAADKPCTVTLSGGHQLAAQGRWPSPNVISRWPLEPL